MKTVCTILLLLTLAICSAQKTVSIVSDVWEPYNHSIESPQKGYVIDILEKIYMQDDRKVEYIITPWSRALLTVEQGRFDGLIGSLQTPERVKMFFFPDEECGVTYNEFYVLKDNSWHFNGKESLDKICIGVIGGYTYPELDDYIKSNSGNAARINTAFGENALEQNIRLLLAGKIDAVLVNEKNIRSTIKKLKLGNQLKQAGIANKPQKMYVAFSRKTADGKELAVKFSEGIRGLRKSGELKKILAAYDLNDWK